MSVKTRNIVIKGNEYEVGRLHVGTRAERLAYAASAGDEWNEIENGVSTHYTYTDGRWVPQAMLSSEHVEITCVINGGQGMVLAGELATVTIVDETTTTTTTFPIGSNNKIVFDAPIGSTYTVVYPTFPLYDKIPDTVGVADTGNSYLTVYYNDATSHLCSVVMENSNPSSWTVGYNTSIPLSLLSTTGDGANSYGTFVIDEANKKYAKLMSEDHGKFADGYEYTHQYGNVFRRLPAVWYVVINNNGTPTLLLSDREIAGGYLLPECWIGTFKGCTDGSNILLSRGGLDTTQNRQMSTYFDWAEANKVGTLADGGNEYGLVSYFDQQKLAILFLARYGSSDSESISGTGLATAGSSYYTHKTGLTISIGDGNGDVTDSTLGYKLNKLFGIEDISGSTNEYRQNILSIIEGGVQTIAIYEGNTISPSEFTRTFTKPIINSSAGLFIKNMVLGPYFDILPTTTGGGATSSTYWCDAAFGANDGEAVCFGGCASDSAGKSGLFSSEITAKQNGGSTKRGARLAFRGDITKYTYVTGDAMSRLHS